MSFMPGNAPAMPQLVCRNCLRLKPRCLPFTSASSLIRASTFFCVALCGGGRYSPLDTIWVGIGVAADAASAPATRRCSRSLSQVLMVLLRWSSTVLEDAHQDAPLVTLDHLGGPSGAPSRVRLRLKPSYAPSAQASLFIAPSRESSGAFENLLAVVAHHRRTQLSKFYQRKQWNPTV